MSKRRSKSKRVKSKSRIKKKPFGGYNINFTNCEETLEEVFGRKPITPAQMTKILWRYIKKWRLGGKN